MQDLSKKKHTMQFNNNTQIKLFKKKAKACQLYQKKIKNKVVAISSGDFFFHQNKNINWFWLVVFFLCL